MLRIQPLPHFLSALTRLISDLVVPLDINFEILWGLIYLNLKVGRESWWFGKEWSC
jgi:hypothetical protein